MPPCPQLISPNHRRLLLQERPCCASFDLRSARSQQLFLAAVWTVTLTIWILNFGIRKGLCDNM